MIAKKANGKKNALAMKKKGVGIFAPKVLSAALSEICGAKKLPRTEVTKKAPRPASFQHAPSFR